MKKLFYTLLAITLLFNARSVYAENSETLTESGDADASATVGTVDTPVYEVQVNWHHLTFDWKYNDQTQSYSWRSHLYCIEEEYGSIDWEEEWRAFYSDNTCETPFEHTNQDNLESSDKLYYRNYLNPIVVISDRTQNGSVDIGISWTPVQKYDFTTASFSYSTEGIDGYEEYVPFNSSTIPTEARHECGQGLCNYYYDISPTLGVDTTKTVTTPTTGETIGTFTVTVETN